MALLMVMVLVIYSCETDETQTVARFTKLVWADEFDTDGAPNPAIWGYDIGTGNNGWGNGDQPAPGGSLPHNNAENGQNGNPN